MRNIIFSKECKGVRFTKDDGYATAASSASNKVRRFLSGWRMATPEEFTRMNRRVTPKMAKIAAVFCGHPEEHPVGRTYKMMTAGPNGLLVVEDYYSRDGRVPINAYWLVVRHDLPTP